MPTDTTEKFSQYVISRGFLDACISKDYVDMASILAVACVQANAQSPVSAFNDVLSGLKKSVNDSSRDVNFDDQVMVHWICAASMSLDQPEVLKKGCAVLGQAKERHLTWMAAG